MPDFPVDNIERSSPQTDAQDAELALLLAEGNYPERTVSAWAIYGSLRRAGLPQAALADAFRVGRSDRAIYGFLEEAALRKSFANCITRIGQALLPAVRGELADLYRSWDAPLSGGTTLRKLLAADRIDVEAIRAAARVLTVRAA